MNAKDRSSLAIVLNGRDGLSTSVEAWRHWLDNFTHNAQFYFFYENRLECKINSVILLWRLKTFDLAALSAKEPSLWQPIDRVMATWILITAAKNKYDSCFPLQFSIFNYRFVNIRQAGAAFILSSIT